MRPNSVHVILFWLAAASVALIVIFTVTFSSTRQVTQPYLPGRRVKWPFNDEDTHKVTALHPDESPPGDSIFFVVVMESDEQVVARLTLTMRQICAIESAGYWNFDKDIYVLVVASMDTATILYGTSRAYDGLNQYPNIHFRMIQLETFLDDTPMTAIMAKLSESQYSEEHTKGIIMLATLYKFGGTCLDTDVILLNPLPEYKSYIGTENEESGLSAAVIKFGLDEAGRQVAEKCVKEILKSFNGASSRTWQQVIFHVLYDRCEASSNEELWDQDCQGFYITPLDFASFPLRQVDLLFVEGNTDLVIKMLQGSYALRVQANKTQDLKGNAPGIPYYDLAGTNCPATFENVGDQL